MCSKISLLALLGMHLGLPAWGCTYTFFL